MSTQIGIHTLWPTTILEVDYANQFQKSIDDIIESVEFVPAPAEWGRTHKVSKSDNGGYWNDDVISKYNLHDLDYEIHNLAREYCNIIKGGFTTYRRTSWFTLFERGDYAHVHNHSSSSISGCYYYKTNGEDGNIFFTTPVSQMSTNPTYITEGSRNVFQTNIGKMLLFPGWLNHGVMTNETEEKRISLAFNIEFNYLENNEQQ